jgi:hypothetical protein
LVLQRQQQTMRQVVGAWQLQVYRAELLRHALARLLHKTLAEVFGAWRELALQQMRRRSLLHVSDDSAEFGMFLSEAASRLSASCMCLNDFARGACKPAVR